MNWVGKVTVYTVNDTPAVHDPGMCRIRSDEECQVLEVCETKSVSVEQVPIAKLAETLVLKPLKRTFYNMDYVEKFEIE